MKLSIIVLCYNAPYYVTKLLKSLKTQRDVDYEVVLVDNASHRLNSVYFAIRGFMLKRLQRRVRSSTNLFFSGGMNLGVKLSSPDSTHVLLLNSDTEFRDPLALRKVLDAHKRGVTGFSFLENPPRCDGFFFLVDRDVYAEIGGLDENFKWWWSITKFQGYVLQRGLSVVAIRNYESLLVHFGGKSGDAWKAVNSSAVPDDAGAWFPNGRGVSIVEQID